jgi:glutamate-1-semialdehyde 2,1-aminomutase
LYSEPSRYNWMLQFYLRDTGLALSWVGSGRIIFSLNYTDDDFEAVAERFVAAAVAMKQDGWWWRSDALTNRRIRRRILRESIRQLLPRRGKEALPPRGAG